LLLVAGVASLQSALKSATESLSHSSANLEFATRILTNALKWSLMLERSRPCRHPLTPPLAATSVYETATVDTNRRRTRSEFDVMKMAILDDYQNVALTMADWSRVESEAEITVFTDHVGDPDAVVARLQPFDVVCVMRERTPLPREVLERLPRLKLIASTGPGNASIDMHAAQEYDIHVTATGYRSTPTIELTWALILAAVRNLVGEASSLRAGGWQTSLGRELSGRVLGVLGLGRIGSEIARIGTVFGMDVIAWSQHLTPQRARAAGAAWVSKEELFGRSDVLSIHLVLSDRTRGLVNGTEIAAMKPTSWLVNTSRGPIIEHDALLAALRSKSIAGAALDVFDVEPLPAEHPLRTLPNVVATPHIGYVTEDLYRTFYSDAAASIAAWLDER
jgi:phosphoglycerate dehydrogenase-like enzyme